MSYGELTLPPVWTGRNKQNGRFLKGHVPANKGKKWSGYMGKRAMKRAAKGWKNLDNHPKQLFGEHILLSSAKTEEKEQAKALAREQAQRNAQEAAQKRAGVLLENGMIPLSQRERRIVERLNQNK